MERYLAQPRYGGKGLGPDSKCQASTLVTPHGALILSEEWMCVGGGSGRNRRRGGSGN